MTFTYASLFAGIGGFDLGFDRAGMTPTFQAENHKPSIRVLETHWPNVPRGEDVRDVAGSALGRPHLVAAGFPCKDLIVRKTGGRAGLAGKHSSLYWEFHRLVDEHLRLVDATRPRWTVLENTDGLLTSNAGRDLAAVVMGLEHLGYGWAYRVVDARSVGSDQRRRRIIILAHRGGDPRPAWQVLDDSDAGTGPAGVRREPTGGVLQLVRPGTAEGVRVYRKRANARTTAVNGGWSSYEDATFYNTLTSNDSGSAVRQKHIVEQGGRLRGLTPVEWERLQGFPDGWTSAAPESMRYRALGDAMNVNLATWLGRRIQAVDATLPLLPAVA